MESEGALSVARIILENGGSTAMAERAFKNLMKNVRPGGFFVVWRLDCILVTAYAGGQPRTLMQEVGPIGVNLSRASEAAVLSERVAKGELDEAGLAAEIERINKLPSPYNRWMSMLAAACAGGFFAKTMAGDYGAFVICAVSAGIGQLVRSQLQAWRFTRASVTFFCALLSGVIATAALRFGVSQDVPATLIGSIIYTVPGLLLINGFLDLTVEQFLFVGAQRLTHATFLFLILTIAVMIADALL